MKKTLLVRLHHYAFASNAYWCDPLGWEPANKVPDSVYLPARDCVAAGWWSGGGSAEVGRNTAGIVWIGDDPFIQGQVVHADPDDLRVFSCGSDCRELGKIKVEQGKDGRFAASDLPAFPTTADSGNCCGLSIRDYFAAHAPAEPQGWYKSSKAFDDECTRQWYAQWPWVWADMVLAARK